MLFDPEDNEEVLLVTDEGPRHPPQRQNLGSVLPYLYPLLYHKPRTQPHTTSKPNLSESPFF